MKIGSFILSKHAFVVSFILCFLFTYSATTAQDLPKFIPPSPEASALFRFQDYPMDYSTGLPSITIPLYEVKSGSLSVPVTLGYHASGRRVSDLDGPVALGWSLDAGGIVSRTIYGSPDFGTPSNGTYFFPNPLRTTGLSNSSDYQYFEKIMHYTNTAANILPWTESEYDVFSYNFGGNGGKFIFTDSANYKTPVLLPYKPYIITPVYTTSAPIGNVNYNPRGLTEIDITDDKGVFYKFAQTETTTADGDYAVSSLSLSQMISADKADTITFVYTGFTQWSQSFSQQRTFIDNWNITVGATAPTNPAATTENASGGSYTIKRLTEIDFKLGKVVINLVSGSDKIDNIQVKDLNNHVVKSIQFNRSQMDVLKQGGSSSNQNYSQVNNKLDALTFNDNNGTAVEKYAFNYFPTKYYNTETTVDTHYCDWWGFYNASGDINMIPDYYLPDNTGLHVGGSDWNREPNLDALKSGVLKTITYPTGGSTTYEYENNKYIDPFNNVKYGPGLRVHQVKTTTISADTIRKMYAYGIGGIGYGFLELKPSINTMGIYQEYAFINASGWYPSEAGTYSQYTFTSGFDPSLSAMAGRPVIYTEVTEYQGTDTVNAGKTVYKYDNYAWAPAGMPASGMQYIPNMHIYNANYWNNPSLLSRIDYKNSTPATPNPSYIIKKQVTNNYTANNIGDVAGLHVQRAQVWPQTGISGNMYIEQNVEQYRDGAIYTFSDYHIPVGIKTLSSSLETDYSDDGTTILNTNTSYSYNTRFLLSQKTQTTSDNATVISNTTYPFDYTGNAVFTQMLSSSVNMVNFPIEQTEFKNTTPVKGLRTNYYTWNSTKPIIKPLSVDIKYGANNYETRYSFNSYDQNGNVLEQQKTNDVKEVYLWGYNAQYPIAKIVGSDYATVNSVVPQTLIDANTGIDANLRSVLNALRTDSRTSKALVTTFTYAPLIGQTSVTDPAGKTAFYEYYGFNRLKNIKDYQGNIIKNYQYNYANSCGANCVVLPMQTYSGSNTIGYPVGVFNVNGQLLGQATFQSQYITLWNANTANQAKGVLSAGIDVLHFDLALASGQTAQTAPPGVIGLRFYQVDLAYTSLDAVRATNGEFVDFGDGISMRLGTSFNPNALPASTTANYFSNSTVPYLIHTYATNTLHILTFYHNDGMESSDFDNFANPATSLTQLTNFRGNLPLFTQTIGGSCYQQASMNSIANISNWNSLTNIQAFYCWPGDRVTQTENLSYPQDFLANDKNLTQIITTNNGSYGNGILDASFKISRLKSDWNTYFTNLNRLAICEYNWNHEDLSSLKKLSFFTLICGTPDHTNLCCALTPLDPHVIDNCLIQIAAGAGATISNGLIQIVGGGVYRTSSSDAAYNLLISKGWTINLNL